MTLIPETKTIGEILDAYATMIIPNFQRDYSWEKEYYNTFFTDILEGLSIENDKIDKSDYFIGMMVFSGKWSGDFIDVIDGQQRLTVITIILSVIASKFQSINEEDLAKGIFRYIKRLDVNNLPKVKLMSNTSHPYFEIVVQSLEINKEYETISEEEENIKETYKYFEAELDEIKLRKRLDIKESIEYKDILAAIRDQILHLGTITILTDDKKSGYEIFEILNANGKNLAAIDLIKNTIYSKFHADPNSKNTMIEAKWEGMKRTLRERDKNIGFITFYRHFWISKYTKATNVKLYDAFKKKIKSNEKDYEVFVDTVANEAKTYLKIVCPNISDYANRKEYHWLVQSLKSIEEIFGVSQARIALLALFDIKERNLISTKYYKKTIKYIEDFIFVYSTLLKNQANIYETRFSKFAIKLRASNSKAETHKIIQEDLFNVFNEKFPPKEEFITAFKNLQYTKSSNFNCVVTKYVLDKLSISFDKKDIYHNDSSIEHIINEDRSIIETLNIGNLICLEGPLNNEADNLEFDEKIEVYKKSKYNQVEKFCEENRKFDLGSIDKRAEQLAEYYYENILLKP